MDLIHLFLISSNTVLVEDAIKFRRDMVEHYKLGHAKCMITGVYGRHRLTAAHIWPKGQTENPKLEKVKALPPDFEDSYRNGLILLRPLEKAYDKKQLCFMYNFLNVCIITNRVQYLILYIRILYTSRS
jgi:hypothetical protein